MKLDKRRCSQTLLTLLPGLQVTSVIVSRDGGRGGKVAMDASSASLIGRATFSLLTFDHWVEGLSETEGY